MEFLSGFSPGPIRTLKLCYIGILVAYVISSIGWFLAAEGTRIKQIPVVGQLIHHTVGVFFHSSLMFIPVNAASDLFSGFIVNLTASLFDRWSSLFRESAVTPSGDADVRIVMTKSNDGDLERNPLSE